MNVIVPSEKKKISAVSVLTRPESLSTSYSPGFERDQNFKSGKTSEPCQHREAVHYGTFIIIAEDYNVMFSISLSILSWCTM